MTGAVVALLGWVTIVMAVWPIFLAMWPADTEAEADEMLARWLASQPLESIISTRIKLLSGFALVNAAAFLK